MAEPVWSEGLVTRTDLDGTLLVIGHAWGPAGYAEIELAPSVFVAVDTAESNQLSSIRVEPAADRDRAGEVLDALVGAERSELLLRFAELPEGRTRRLMPQRSTDTDDWDSARRRDERSEPRFASRLPGNDAGEAFGRVVSVGALAETADEALAGAIAFVEFGELAGETAVRQDLPVLDAVAERALVHGARGLDDLAADLGELALVDADVADRLRALVMVAQKTASRDVRAALRRVENVLRAEDDRRRSDAQLSAAAAAAQAVSEPAEIQALVEPSRRVEPRSPGWHLELDDGLLTVRAPEQELGTWLRVLRAENLAPLAVVPLLAEADHDRAEALVPAELELADLVVETTRYPRVVAPGGGVEAVSQAITVGRDACEAERFGRHEQARDRWWRCAELWQALGDTTRAAVARRYADEIDRRVAGAGSAFLAERVTEALSHAG
ncbi:hypothetical protein [Rhabdothermincola salaria]|uniref:hypothetical protein n=1 Tax=Rhabdothermincola salaria TaxID=2903142 RepID=UPI001E62C9A5|nr:hypothetical protein [Rhabdothermincola salaria]MCD9624206.1 hypothetical protein [Rhabdothermincola salaria]